MTHCYERDSEIIVGDKSHFNLWEQGGVSQVCVRHPFNSLFNFVYIMNLIIIVILNAEIYLILLMHLVGLLIFLYKYELFFFKELLIITI